MVQLLQCLSESIVEQLRRNLVDTMVLDGIGWHSQGRYWPLQRLTGWEEYKTDWITEVDGKIDGNLSSCGTWACHTTHHTRSHTSRKGYSSIQPVQNKLHSKPAFHTRNLIHLFLLKKYQFNGSNLFAWVQGSAKLWMELTVWSRQNPEPEPQSGVQVGLVRVQTAVWNWTFASLAMCERIGTTVMEPWDHGNHLLSCKCILNTQTDCAWKCIQWQWLGWPWCIEQCCWTCCQKGLWLILWG